MFHRFGELTTPHVVHGVPGPGCGFQLAEGGSHLLNPVHEERGILGVELTNGVIGEANPVSHTKTEVALVREITRQGPSLFAELFLEKPAQLGVVLDERASTAEGRVSFNIQKGGLVGTHAVEHFSAPLEEPRRLIQDAGFTHDLVKRLMLIYATEVFDQVVHLIGQPKLLELLASLGREDLGVTLNRSAIDIPDTI